MSRRGFARRVTSLLAGSRFISTVLENHAMQEEQVDVPTKQQGPDVSKVILRNDVSECEEVLKALEEDPEKEMKLKEMNEEGLTLIHCAVMCDKHCAVRCDRQCTKLLWLKRLLEMGAAVGTKDQSEATILHHAIKCGCPQIIDFILQNHHKDLVNSTDCHQSTPLHYAVQYIEKVSEMEKVLKELIAHGADVNAKNKDNAMPLHLAAELDKDEAIDLLLDNGADIHATNKRKHTPLLAAAAYGKKSAIAALAGRCNKEDMNQVDGDGKSVLFLTVEAGDDIAVNKIVALTRQISSETDNLPCKASKTGDIPLHIAASQGNLNVVKSLLEKAPYCEHQIKRENNSGKTPLHVAAENGEKEVVEYLVFLHPTIIHFCEKDGSDTPLHLACANGHCDVVSYLLNRGAHFKARNACGETPFHLAASRGHKELVAQMADFSELCVVLEDNKGRTALRCACDERCIGVISTLLKKGSDITCEDMDGVTAIEAAIESGHEDVVEVIVDSDDWVEALRHTYPDKDSAKTRVNPEQSIYSYNDPQARERRIYSDQSIYSYRGEIHQLRNLERGEENEPGGYALTPLRMMILKMPVVAAKVLNRCTLSGSDPKHLNTVVFDYQFLEDFRNEKTTSQRRQCCRKAVEEGEDEVDSPTCTEGNYKDEEGRYSKTKHLEAVKQRDKKRWQSTWGPIRFRKSNHPLMTMVDAGRLDLLEHPLVGSLLHYKWKTFGMWMYLTNMFTYLLFVTFLTTFALTVMNPDTKICRAVLNGTFCNTTGNGECGDCELSSAEYDKIVIFAILTILMTVVRFGLEVLQMVQFKQWYLLDWTNWIELALFAFTIMFIFVFPTPCLCPHNWQWELGILAVFLAWIDLVLFVQKFPVVGIYIVMFLKICKTFLWTVVLTTLLIISFGLAFYMAFYEPQLKATGRTRDTFSTPAYAIFKTMAMSTGEIDFDPNFHISRDAAEPELPFLPVTAILWIIFISVMPILYVNMLTGLAVDDVKEILKGAELSKLALQVELVLSVEERMPKVFQRWFGWGTIKWWEANIVRKTSQWQKVVHVIWGGKLYNLRENIDAVVNPPVHTVEDQTVVLLSEMKTIKQAIAEVAVKHGEQNTKEDSEIDEEEMREDTWKEDVVAQLRENSESIVEEMERMKTQLLAEVEEKCTVSQSRLLEEVEQKRTISQSIMQNFIHQNVFQPLTQVREQIDHMQQDLIKEQKRQIDHMQQTLIKEQARQIDHIQQTLILKQVEQRRQNEQLTSHNQMLEQRLIRLESLVLAMAQHQGIQVEDPVI